MERAALYAVYVLLGTCILAGREYPPDHLLNTLLFPSFLALILVTSDLSFGSRSKISYRQLLGILERRVNADPDALRQIADKNGNKA